MSDLIENILFDLDGTLTNPKVGIINSILYALKKLDIIELNTGELITFIGSPLRDAFIERYNLSSEVADQAVNIFREYFSTKGLYENELYEGIPDLLKSLNSQNFKLYVATSKPTVFAFKILRYFDIEKYFIDIIGSNLDNTLSDKTEIISHTISLHNLQRDKSLMVGDRKYDIVAAKNNSIKSIGVTYGYGSLKELTLHSPDYIVKNCTEIENILFNYKISKTENNWL